VLSTYLCKRASNKQVSSRAAHSQCLCLRRTHKNIRFNACFCTTVAHELRSMCYWNLHNYNKLAIIALQCSDMQELVRMHSNTQAHTHTQHTRTHTSKHTHTHTHSHTHTDTALCFKSVWDSMHYCDIWYLIFVYPWHVGRLWFKGSTLPFGVSMLAAFVFYMDWNAPKKGEARTSIFFAPQNVPCERVNDFFLTRGAHSFARWCGHA